LGEPSIFLVLQQKKIVNLKRMKLNFSLFEKVIKENYLGIVINSIQPE
jgi:hypothetical protein